MRSGHRLTEDYFGRSPLEIAPELLGCVLVHELPDGVRLCGRIVEVEAYVGDGTDPSAHCHSGPTARNRSLFGPPGRLYAYRSYGIHICVNVVCQPDSIGAGILFRAVEPLEGEDRMRGHRGLDTDAPRRQIASGPGRLAEAFAIGLEHDGEPFDGRRLAIHRPAAGSPAAQVIAGPRIGIRRAQDLPYRFHLADDPFVSGPRRARRGDAPAVDRSR
jgi:DNA-3-methyladenine glycosylase